MKLQNIECQLAQAQMSRYLAGEALAEETLSQLERHLASCGECKQAALEKRSSLQTIIGGEPTPPAADPTRAPRPARAVVGARIEVPEEAPANPAAAVFLRKNARTLGLGVALSLVLIGMSFVAGDPTRLFGPKLAPTPASNAKPEATKPEAETLPVDANEEAQAPEVAMPTAATKPAATEPEAGPEVTPPTKHEKPEAPAEVTASETEAPATVKTARSLNQPQLPPPTGHNGEGAMLIAQTNGQIKPALTKRTATVSNASRPARRLQRRPVRKWAPKPAPRRTNGSIRVYDESGRVISTHP